MASLSRAKSAIAVYPSIGLFLYCCVTCQLVERQVERFEQRACAEPVGHCRELAVGRGQVLQLAQATDGGGQRREPFAVRHAQLHLGNEEAHGEKKHGGKARQKKK